MKSKEILKKTVKLPQVKDIEAAAKKIKSVARRTLLTQNQVLSDHHNCQVFLKREDLQIVRSYKIRGAYNMISSLSAQQTSCNKLR